MPTRKKKPEDALTAAFRIISYRDRSVKELVEKLQKKGFGQDEIDNTLSHLLEQRYLDDGRFATLLAGTRINNKNWGFRKIALELSAKGISGEIINGVISSLGEEAEEAAAGRALKKWSRRTGVSPEGLQKGGVEKAFRHLKARGFSTPLIMKTIGRLKTMEG